MPSQRSSGLGPPFEIIGNARKCRANAWPLTTDRRPLTATAGHFATDVKCLGIQPEWGGVGDHHRAHFKESGSATFLGPRGGRVACRPWDFRKVWHASGRRSAHLKRTLGIHRIAVCGPKASVLTRRAIHWTGRDKAAPGQNKPAVIPSTVIKRRPRERLANPPKSMC